MMIAVKVVLYILVLVAVAVVIERIWPEKAYPERDYS